ncbi:cation efflux system protein [Prolixibacter bellariivorans]|uniref:Cation efflux system protein n=1 Tax=Prolixibacter bellariivorans TaxID=314319 RepID=A0A5M4AV64_9BACT|nr:efflux RND transporter periplasmic adaptor subunit [Prolixibacter bellariivorans]GET31498.1 cation efflux system protein [Prolixibacter bellariivorans]
MNFKINLIVLLVATTLFATGCGNKGGEKASDVKQDSIKIRPVKVMSLEPQEVSRTINQTASFVAYHENYLTAASPGRIEKIYVEVGDHVKAGQLLVQMDRTQLKQAELQLENLKTDFGRLDTLQKTGTVTQQKYDQLATQYNVAKENVQFLKENTELRAPLSGVITSKYFEDGEMYSGSPNTSAGKAAIVTLMQLNPIKAVINMTEKDFPRIHKGMKVDVTADVYPGKVFEGTVYRIHPAIDPASRTFTVEITVPNTDEKIRPGMYGKVAIHVGRDVANLVPAIAVLKQEGTNQRYLFKYVNGKAQRVDIQLGERFDADIEVISDKLKPGDQIIVVGQANLVEGNDVKIVK